MNEAQMSGVNGGFIAIVVSAQITYVILDIVMNPCAAASALSDGWLIE